MTHRADHRGTGPGAEDHDLAALLHEAVSDVLPPDALPEIRARIAGEVPTRRRSRLVVTLAAALVTAAVIGGVAWLNRNHNGATVAGGARTVTVAAYFLGDTAAGPRLFRETHRVRDVTGSDAQAAVTAALAQPEDPDYHTGFPPGTAARVSDHGSRIVVDLSGGDLHARPPGGAAAARMALQSIVWTVQETVQRSVGVVFRVDGGPARDLLGVDAEGPVREADADSTLSPVSVAVAEGAHLHSGTTVYGQAAAYEGTVVWQLQQHGSVVRQGHTTAGQCCTLSPFALELSAPPGRYTLVVQDTSASGREGSGVTRDTKQIVVQ